VDRQISKDNERADRLGLILDSDPRKTTPKGNLLAGGEEKDKQGPESEEGRKETTE
jgi:capsid protein